MSDFFRGGCIAFPKPLSEEEEARYIEGMKNGNTQARNILIEHNLRLVAHVAKKYAGSGRMISADFDDMLSIGTIGLIKGIDSFNADKNVRLATYAARCIENAILSQMPLWFQISTPRAIKNQNGVFWHRFPRISTSFASPRTAM